MNPITCGNFAYFDQFDSSNPAPMRDDELQLEITEQFGWGDDYEGGFLYTGDHTPYEGLTVLEMPHIDSSGSVSGMSLHQPADEEDAFQSAWAQYLLNTKGDL